MGRPPEHGSPTTRMPAPQFHQPLELPENPLKRGFAKPRATARNHHRIYTATEILNAATLVRTDVPHAVENTDAAKGRWAPSARCEPDFRDWKHALRVFEPAAKPVRDARLRC